MLKDKLYNYFVRTNGRVWYEYERYVRENIEEHRLYRLKHLRLLLKLNWFYRVKKENTPYLYWDVPLDPNCKTTSKPTKAVPIAKTQTVSKQANSAPVVKGGNHLPYPEIKTMRRKNIEEFVEKLTKYDVVSFDVFDTLILRYVADPKDVFILIGNELGIYDYKTARVRAESDARKRSNNINGEVKLKEICELLSNYLGIDADKAENAEMCMELKVCYANPYIQEVVYKLKALGVRIIATSNMYLNTEQIKAILKKCGYEGIDEVYVSCELEKSKYKGELQKKVTEIVGENLSIIHVGDNYVADYIGSRMAGWKAYYYKNVNEIGKTFRPAKMSKLLSSVYGGIVNGHFHNGQNYEKSVFYELGFGYLGILIVGYCRWINKYAKDNKIDKILFTSRDMYLVYEMYNEYFMEVPNDYIKISRFAAQRFSYQRFSDYYIDSHIRARAQIGKLTIKSVFEELNIEFMKDYISEYGLQENDLFTMNNFELLRDCLNDNKSRMLAEFECEKEASIKYYSQFVQENQRVAIVDLGWQGTNALCLKYLFEEEMNMNISVKSLLMVSASGREFCSNAIGDGITAVYCFSENKNEQLCGQFSPVRMGRFICELLFSSNEKSLKTINTNENGEFVFSYIANEKRNEEGMDEILEGARAFVDIWEKSAIHKREISGFDAILPLNKLSYNDICYDILSGNEINPWIGDTKEGAASDIRKIVRR